MDTPSSVGRYKIKRWVTSGAMGDIYEAHDPLIERPIALKILRRELLERGDAAGWLLRFRHEARAAGRLLHPNIVTLLDYGEEGGVPFLAMEYVEGESLDVVLRRSGRLPYADALAIITQMLGALDFAHSHQVVHRDVKPSNVLLTRAGLAKIADFGIAHIEASDLTSEGDVLGTPSYMAPEQLLGKIVDARADQFAAAAVFFEMLSGAKPFHGKSLAESMLNMEQRGPADLCALNPEVAPALRSVIETALAFDPARRYPGVAEFQRAITALGAGGRVADAPARSDETVFAAIPAVRAPAPSTPPAEASEAPLAVDLLAEVERDLATYIGPMAKIAVRRAAKSTVDLAVLYQSLASYIDAENDRDTFIGKGLQRVRTTARWQSGDGSRGSRAKTGAARPTVAFAITPDALNRIEADLTEYIGPIASILLRQLLSKSASLPDFYRDLAAYIPNEGDRANFLRSRHGA
jgi:serine/threonine-protein kinase